MTLNLVIATGDENKQVLLHTINDNKLCAALKSMPTPTAGFAEVRNQNKPMKRSRVEIKADFFGSNNFGRNVSDVK